MREYQPITISQEEFFDEWEDAEYADEFGGYEDDQFHSMVGTVRERLHELDERFDGDWVGVLEDAVDGMNVQLYMGDQVWLSRYVETKHLTDDRSATGRAGVWAIVTALLWEHDHLLQYAVKHDLRWEYL